MNEIPRPPPPDALTLLGQRASATKLSDPAPPPAVLDRILTAALRAPDHGALRAFRVLVIEGDARRAFGELLSASALRSNPALDDAGLEATRRKAARAPMILTVVCTPKAHAKVPEIEQIITAGCLAHALLLGLQAAGFGAMWRTGPAAYDAALKEGLGLRAEDHIVGFVYVGTPAGEPPALPRPSTEDFVSRWTPG
jgi:nitroreductase